MAALEKTPAEIVSDLTVLASGKVVDVRPYNKVAYQVIDGANGSATIFTAGVITVERSIDGEEFVAMASPLTITSVGVKATIDVTDIGWLRFRVSTVGANEGYARIAMLLIKELN